MFQAVLLPTVPLSQCFSNGPYLYVNNKKPSHHVGTSGKDFREWEGNGTSGYLLFFSSQIDNLSCIVFIISKYSVLMVLSVACMLCFFAHDFAAFLYTWLKLEARHLRLPLCSQTDQSLPRLSKLFQGYHGTRKWNNK